jgi:hypothetical protein
MNPPRALFGTDQGYHPFFHFFQIGSRTSSFNASLKKRRDKLIAPEFLLARVTMFYVFIYRDEFVRLQFSIKKLA